MSRILSTLAILCLFSVAWCDTITTQSSGVGSSALYSPAVQVFYGTNTSEWASGKPWYTVTSGSNQNVMFGPGPTNNNTIYAYGLIWASSTISGVVRRALNASIVANGTTTPAEGAVIGDTSVTVSIPATTASSYMSAVGLGYLAILSTGTVSSNPGVQVTLVSTTATSASPVLVSANVASNTFTLGNIWYDIGSGTFFFTYTIMTSSTSKYTVYLGGIVASTGDLYWAAPGLAVNTASADTLANSVSGPNNWLNSTSIIVAYKDTSASPPVTYFSVISKSTNATAGTPGVLATDSTTSPANTYLPLGVWASNNTYGIALSLTVATTSGMSTTYAYSIENYLNVTSGSATVMRDSGVANSTTAAATGLVGWQYTSGYALLAEYPGTTTDTLATTTYTLGLFYANGTANGTAATIATSLVGPLNVFEDINGTMWVGWTDIDVTQTNVYNLYVARLEGQINSASSAGNALKTIMAFVAFCLVAVFAF